MLRKGRIVLICLSVALQIILVCSCGQTSRIPFLQALDINADSLISDTVPLSIENRGYTLSTAQLKGLLGERVLEGMLSYNDSLVRLLVVKPMKEDYLLFFVSHALANNVNAVLFNSDGRFLDAVYCGQWNHEDEKLFDENTKKMSVKKRIAGYFRGTCEFLSDSTFRSVSERYIDDTLFIFRYDYLLKNNCLQLLEKRLDAKPYPNKQRRIHASDCAPDECEVKVFDLNHKPYSDETVFDDWNEIISAYSDYCFTHRFPPFSHSILLAYQHNPKGMLKWLCQHQNDPNNSIRSRLAYAFAYCDYFEGLSIRLEDLRKEIDALSETEERRYLDSFYNYCEQKYAEEKEEKERLKFLKEYENSLNSKAGRDSLMIARPKSNVIKKAFN